MFGDRLKELREDANLTQEDLAKKLNISRQAISGYELETSEPNIDNLLKIADIFKVSLDYLLGRTKEKYNINLLDINNREIIYTLIESLKHYKITKK